MNRWIRICFFLFLPILSDGQQQPVSSLEQVLKKAHSDSAKYYNSRELFYFYQETNRDSALWFASRELQLSTRNNKKLNEAESLDQEGYALTGLGRFEKALQVFSKAFAITEDPKSEKNYWDADNVGSPHRKRLSLLAYTHQFYGILLGLTDNPAQEIFHYKEARRIAAGINYPRRTLFVDMDLGQLYLNTGKLDSALWYAKEAEDFAIQINKENYLSLIYWIIAGSYLKKNDTALALHYFYQGIQWGISKHNLSSLAYNYNSLAKYYIGLADKDSSLYYSVKTLQTFRFPGFEGETVVNMGICYDNLYQSYKIRNQFDSAFKYQGLALVTLDTLYTRRIKSLTDFQNLNFRQQIQLKELEEDRIKEESKMRVYGLLAGIIIFIVIAFLLFRNNVVRRKANRLLKQEKELVESALSELKSTQAQLIQSEKMASLGELTAGIAHEIQNPLNFVNNFSEVNKEMIEELKGELATGNLQLANEIADDIKNNEEKINHHGKRADAIVKGMLQHSRASTGKKEPTDINALCDEYLRLSYHGLRAKDKDFNAEIEKDFDESIGKINIVPQDIGRVLLNLFNNAFYAINQQKNKNINLYEPGVSISTKKSGNSVFITVRDNGDGISKEVVDKIFQPFFTTKPTGEGTGLGLSLSYDIVKAHGGEIKVESKKGEGSKFIIQLPVG